ncbi:hypothetical protein GCM10009557_09570 [Virgisporangium ochraceum]|uniref:Uncharacterized protein n=1 Tax=Virgisporangium ochraceum TaxID=65505 RepID=A0A8J4EE56_9ACTN|nr:hypothetical protein [Virgisporangium ochraceum]GIJ71394.1 hypothetical protein Voc01_063110 [Virgisporangium ochraceum]
MPLFMRDRVRITRVFIEVIGRRPLPEYFDRDDVEDALAEALGSDGAVTGAGTGETGWHLDVEIVVDVADSRQVLRRLALALVEQDLGWVVLRPEQEPSGRPAQEIV